MTLPTKRLRRWSARVPVSAAHLNEAVDAVNQTASATIENRVAIASRLLNFETFVITDIFPALGHVICERTTTAPVFPQVPETIRVQLWPELYIPTNYTYTDNNTRTHTPSGTTETMTPPIRAGEWLRVEWMDHPDARDAAGTGFEPYTGYVDCNRVARMWAEEPPP